MTQFDLLDEKTAKPLEFSIEMVKRSESFHDSVLLAQTIAGLKDKQITGSLGIDAAQWSRIKNGEAHFPTNQKLTSFMKRVGNDIPLIWLAESRGYDFTTMQKHRSNLERENERLRAEIAKRDDAIALFMAARK